MKAKHYIALLPTLLLPVLLAGCGNSSNKSQLPVSALEQSQACIGCHPGNVSPGTGKLIIEEYKVSVHATKYGASCPDCHAPANHPTSCAKCHGGAIISTNTDVIHNPDESRQCYLCHGPAETSYLKYAPLITSRFPSEAEHTHFPNLATPHVLSKAGQRYNPATVSTTDLAFQFMTTAAYVTTQNENKCRTCHNPHKNQLIPQFAEWARSGLAALKSPAFIKYDFKNHGSRRSPVDIPNNLSSNYPFCLRCHTSTGFINYVNSSFRNISAWGNPVTDRSKQVLYCNTCHYNDQNQRSYSYSVRNVPAAKGYYNYSSIATGKIIDNFPFENVNQSNLCMNCHVGFNSGRVIKLMNQNAYSYFKNYTSFFIESATLAANSTILNGFLNSHYFAAGSTMQRVVGYEYDTRNYADEDEYEHRFIGINNYKGTDTKGQCVMCHTYPGRMTFLPVERLEVAGSQTGTITKIESPICTKCHDGSFEPAMDLDFINAQKNGYKAALDALLAQLQLRKIYFASNPQPYLFKEKITNGISGPDITKPFKDWRNVDVFGAAFNYNYLWHEFGAFAHNSRYTKRLIYDSIDYLDDGKLNFTVGTTLNNLPANTPYKGKAKAYLLNNGATTLDLNERM